jgi:hypothetical protein
MHCPYLQHNDNLCNAVEPQFSPSEFEVDEYCATEQHLRCPLYRDHLLNAVSMFLDPKAVEAVTMFLKPKAAAPDARLLKIK